MGHLNFSPHALANAWCLRLGCLAPSSIRRASLWRSMPGQVYNPRIRVESLLVSPVSKAQSGHRNALELGQGGGTRSPS